MSRKMKAWLKKNRLMSEGKGIRYLSMLATVWTVALLFVSCKEKEDPVIEVTSVTITPPALTLTVGDRQTLTATVEPGNATDKTVTWSSSLPAAEVDASSGEVTAKAAGTTYIIATTANGLTATCAVTVAEVVIEVTSVTVSPGTLELQPGEKQTLKATVEPEDATNKTVTWSSSNTAIAEVNASSGEVTAIAVGTADIIATAVGGRTATCTVTVTGIKVSSITVSPTILDLKTGEKQTLTATVNPENAADKTVTWSSSLPEIAEVNASTGEVTAKAGGMATITATASGGQTATCEIAVWETVGELIQEGDILIIAYGGGTYEDMVATGFDMHWTWNSSIAQIMGQLDQAHNAGMKILVYYDYIDSNTEAAVNAFKGHPGFGGYMLADEPPVQDFEYYDQLVRKIQALDPEHYCYVNLLPNYAVARQLGTSSYTEYIETYAKLPTGFMSFDNYPTNGKGNVEGNWYLNMEQVRNVANKYGIPFWTYVSSTRGAASDPEFTLGELSLMVYTNLAYGSQAIQYFVFAGSSTSWYPYFHTPVNDGQRTRAYDYVFKLNHEIKRLSHIFSKSKVIGVWHTGTTIPSGTVRLQEENPPEMPFIKSLKTNDRGALVSLIEKDNNRYLIIVNRSYVLPMTLTLTVDGNAVKRVLKDGTIASMTSGTVSVDKGDAAIYTWEK